MLEIFEGGGFTTLNGGAGNDSLVCIDTDATLNGGTGNDRLSATFGKFALNGGDGNDVLTISSPFDDSTMTGGAGADTFILGPGGADFVDVIITDFAGTGAAIGDRIDLTGIDANALVVGNQAFIWGGSFTAGHLRYVGGVLQGNTDADTAAEFEIQLVGAPTLVVGGAGSDILL